jgi:hypothetical protein
MIPDKKDILLPKLYDFYNIEDNINQMLPIIMGDSKLSIRILDWFVTNYSKYKKIKYNLNNTCFNVWMDYKAQLKGYKKKLFDPFCRKKRIPFYYSNEKYIVTTIGQLNFFRWAISKKILNYINENFIDIYNDMSKKKIELIDSDTTTINESSLIDNDSIENDTIQIREKIEVCFDF